MVRPLRVSLWEVVDEDIRRYGWTSLREYLEVSRSGPKFQRKSVREMADALTTFGFGNYSVSHGTVYKWCKAVL